MRRYENFLAATLLMALGGCSHNTNDMCDGGNCPIVTGDGATPSPDLSVQPDLLNAPKFQYATNSITLPTKAVPFSIDIDGSGPKNKFIDVVDTVGRFLDLQKTVDAAVKAGELVLLQQIVTSDLTTGDNVPVSVDVAAPGTTPKYDGSDHFTIPQGEVTANLKGHIQGGTLGTIVPTKLTSADVQHISVSLPLDPDNLPLTLYGVHVQGMVDKNGIMHGELHGVVRQQDIDSQIIPAVAMILTHQINADPMGSQLLILLFEDMSNPVTKKKCMDASKCCAKSPMTCVILPEEVSSNTLIQGILKPDVQCFDQAGNWKPDPKEPSPDSLSVGFGFTAVKASF